jgi:hypothetical protein
MSELASESQSDWTRGEIEVVAAAVRPDEVARVRAGTRREPSDVDLARHAAIPHRHRVRRPFAELSAWTATGPDPVPGAGVADVAGSVLTQPLQVHEVRVGLIEGLDLAGFPQALLRFGYPKEDPS